MPPEDAPPIDIEFLLNNNRIGFTQSARRHRIRRARVLAVLWANPVVEISAGGTHGRRLLAVGPDRDGRMLEVVAVVEQGRVVVIHAMDARPKLVRLYAERMRDGRP